MANVEGIGEKVAKAIVEFFTDKVTRKRVDNLVNQDLTLEKPAKTTAKKGVAGKTFVFTGTIETPRALAKEMVKKAGGNVASSVSKNTDYVVAGEKAGSKLKKAEDLGVNIVDEAKFFEDGWVGLRYFDRWKILSSSGYQQF